MGEYVTLQQAVQGIKNGDTVALGGNTLHRIPSAIVHLICNLQLKNLKIIKTAGAYDLDILCACDCVSEIHAGYVGYENIGLALHYRKAVETGKVKAMEHACYSVIAGLRAASYGVPFMPINGFQDSDVPQVRGFKYIENPYGNEKTLVVPAITPDWAIIHVQKTDKKGNACIVGATYEDILMVKAAKKVIVTTEEIVDRLPAASVSIASFMIDFVALAPKGAYPCSCAGYNDADYAFLKNFRTFDGNQIENFIKEANANANSHC